MREEIAGLTRAELADLLESCGDDAALVEDILYWRCATDLELYAEEYFPHYCKHPFNEFHRDVFTATKFGERAARRARGAPRGYAKSTLTALIKPIHDVCYGLESFIVLVSNTQNQANGKLKDIRAEIITNDRLARDYGIHFKKRNPGEESYEIHTDSHSCRFEAYGAGAEIRGIRYGAARPSKIVVDDCEHSEEVLNEALREKLANWFKEVISKIGDENTNIEFIGTVLHKQSLLMNLIENPAYESRIYKAIIEWSRAEKLWNEWTRIYTNLEMPKPERDAQAELFFKQNEQAMLEGTKVLWPEKEPYLALMKERVEIGHRAFMKEKQNEPMASSEAVFSLFHWYDEVPEGIRIERSGRIIPWAELTEHAFGVMDPSTGQVKAKKGRLGDYTCILSGYKHVPTGRLFVHEDWTRRDPPTKYIEQTFELHERYAYQKFGVETNLYRNLLIPNLVTERKKREAAQKKKIILPFYDIESIENKEKRIYTLEPKITHGHIVLNRTLSPEFKHQLEDFPHGDHDDCPDALEMLWGLINNRYKPSALSMDAMGGR